MAQKKQLRSYEQVIKEEGEHLKERRRKLFGSQAAHSFDATKFGIALSGGGIRSATINMGFLATLNKVAVLEKADYLSTVSGGGYTGSYIQSTLKQTGDYDQLFHKDHIDYMRNRGEYLIPGSGIFKMWNRLMLVVGFIASLIMSWISPLILGLIIYGTYCVIGELLPVDNLAYQENKSILFQYGIPILLTILIVHFLSNIFLNYDLNISAQFNKLESALVGITLVAFLGIFLASFQLSSIAPERLLYYSGFALLLIVLGYFTNPNALSFHRFYRKQLADTYLHFSGDIKNIKLKNLFNVNSNNVADYVAPYPLVNTCLNLQATNDENFKGTKASDYFLLSPLYCGSKLTRYVPTNGSRGYDSITFPAAVTISAAAINPGMGMYSNKIISILTTLLNARLGYWINNPLKTSSNAPVWWPTYFIKELLSKMGTDNQMLNISDGGHIENLGVYELLRRRCRLILAIDAGADPAFTFSDLENLTIRARNELGLDIRFRKDQIPESVIRPKPSHGYSDRRFAVADVYKIWEEVKLEDRDGKEIEVLVNYKERNGHMKAVCSFKGQKLDIQNKRFLTAKAESTICQESLKVGTLVYVKSSVKAPKGKPVISRQDELKYGTYKYKIYHPAFPHESTSDQFFDPIQWESYYQLGQYMAADVLGIEELDTFDERGAYPDISINKLIKHFDLEEIIIDNKEIELYPTPQTAEAMQEESPSSFERLGKTVEPAEQVNEMEQTYEEESYTEPPLPTSSTDDLEEIEMQQISGDDIIVDEEGLESYEM